MSFTIATKNYVAAVRRRDHKDVGILSSDTDGVDSAIAEWNKRREEHESESKRAARRAKQVPFFGTFLLPVPDAATDFPLDTVVHGKDIVLYSGKYGYSVECDSMIRSFDIVPGTLRAVHVSEYGIETCDDSLVPPFLRDLVGRFGADMVFRAWRLERRSELLSITRADAVCAKYALPPSSTTFWFARKQPELFVYRLDVGGAIVPVHADRVGAVERPEALTPWMRALLDRPDAHAILIEIVQAMCS
jgi:hypothetical protein